MTNAIRRRRAGPAGSGGGGGGGDGNRRLTAAGDYRKTAASDYRIHGEAAATFTMPSTASFTIDALHMSHDEVLSYSEPSLTDAINKYPSGLGTVTAGGSMAGSATYSLPETTTTNPQVAGWGINSATGQLSLECDYLMRNVCNGNTRTFKVRGTVGATSYDTDVTVTLDTSNADIDIPGIDYAVGAGVLRAVSNGVPTVPSTPVAGWSAYSSGGQNWISPTTNNPTKLADWDLRGFRVDFTGSYTGCTIENCIFDNGRSTQPPFIVSTIIMDGTNNKVRYCTIDMEGCTKRWRMNAVSISGDTTNIFEYNKIISAPNDGINANAGTVRNNYIHVSSTNAMEDDGVTYQNYDSVITGTVSSPANVPANGTLIINGQTVNLTAGQTITQVRDAINTAAVPFVTASVNGNTQLVLTLDTTFDSNGDPVTSAFTVAGTLRTHYGLAASLNIWLSSVWGHGDCVQVFGVQDGDVYVHNNWLDARWYGRDLEENKVTASRTAALYPEGPTSSSMIGSIYCYENWCVGQTFFMHAGTGAYPRTGTITLTSGSTTVTGSGTTFLSDFGLSSPGAPSTTNLNDKFWIQIGAAAGNEYTVTNVASNTSLTLSANASVSQSGAKMFKGHKIEGLTQIKNNRYGGRAQVGEVYPYPRWQSQYQDNKFGWTATYEFSGSKTRGDPCGPTHNPIITAISATIASVTETSVTFGFTAQTDTRVYVRHRTTAGPGAWSAYSLLDMTTKKYEPGSLSNNTSYDFMLYAENWNTSYSESGYAWYSGIAGTVYNNASTTKLVADGPTSTVTGSTATPPAPTYVLLTAGSGTWTVPGGVTAIDVFAIGAGGGGGAGDSNYGGVGGRGGGGGAYAEVLSLSVTPGQTVYYNVPAGATGSAGGGVGNVFAVAPSSDTWLNKSTNAAPSSTTNGVLAKSARSGAGDLGGLASASVGTTKYNGGDGANGFGLGGRGGGGAAGPNGAGKNGGVAGSGYSGDGGGGANGGSSSAGSGNSSATLSGAGGNGNAGTGGAAAASGTSQNGNNGTAGGGGSGGTSNGAPGGVGGKGGQQDIWTITAGGTAGPAGGSGGGGSGFGAGNAGAGGSATLGYGGGGGGGAHHGGADATKHSAGGDGGAGCIVIKYS